MYKSPIDIIYGQMRTTIENDVIKAVQDYGINVDKEELVRALKYDRDQYNAGYADGKQGAVVHGWWVLHDDGSATCANCRRHTRHCWDQDSFYRHCPGCGAKMDLGGWSDDR